MAKLMLFTFMIFTLGFTTNSESVSKTVSDNQKTNIEKHNANKNIISADFREDAYLDYLQELEKIGPKEVGVQEAEKSKSSYIPVVDRKNIENTEIDPIKKATTNSEKALIEVVQEVDNELIDLSVVANYKVDHSKFGTLLKKHVNSKGDVNYYAFKKDFDLLKSYTRELSMNPPNNNMSKNERLAFWINVYNAFTIQLILENYPVNSIKDIANGKPWDKLFIKIGQTSYTLNQVENEIIRKRFTEPRIHFAVNCAAASCPPILNDAFYPDRLISQLEERTKSFINNPEYNKFDKTKIQISKIFDWYGSDFNDVKSWLNPYTEINIENAELTFMAYDWSLNEQ